MNRDRLRRSLQLHESCRLKPYTDTTGHITVGWGRNLSEVGLSQDEADALLEHDIDAAITSLVARWPWMQSLDDVRLETLIEMNFQMGPLVLSGFVNTLEDVKAGRYAEAAKRMLASRWAAQSGHRAVRLAHHMESGMA